MPKMLVIFLLILNLSFIFTFEGNELNDFSKLTIKKAYGDLREHQRQQIIILSIVPSLKLNPENVTNLEFTKDGKHYKPETKCFETENRNIETIVKCELNLLELSKGTYIIKSFNYKNKNYPSKAKIEILASERKISDIKLIGFKGKEIVEYQRSQNIDLLFDRELDYKKINYIEIQSDIRKKSKIIINCSIYKGEAYCSANFFVKGGKYKIMYVSYGDEIINSDKEISFDIKEDIVHLKTAYNYYGADITNSRHNSIRFFFDENIVTDYGYFTKFSFTNVKTGKTYDSYDFRRVYGSTGISNQDDYIFDFDKFPPGEYYINYVYKLRSYHSKIKINIEPVKKIDLSKIYQDRDLSEIYEDKDLEDC